MNSDDSDFQVELFDEEDKPPAESPSLNYSDSHPNFSEAERSEVDSDNNKYEAAAGSLIPEERTIQDQTDQIRPLGM